MITFACAQCASKFKVKDDFAGRTSKCPTCKQPVTVPHPGKEQPVPRDRIEGSASSVHEAGIDAEVTLHPGASSADGKSVTEVLNQDPKGASRYALEGEIARGGMGAVLRGIDRDIRREVAIKFMLDDRDARKKARFVEEAQITGQLEHPNIVPVHELGLDAKKRLFFTMKMVRGHSLAQVIESLANEPGAAKQWSLGRLLAVFVNICNGLGFAHSRNVIHRDLKPANIMVGDFGEVYVMDWGLAKVLGERGPDRKPAKDAISAPKPSLSGVAGASVSTSREVAGDLTQDGAIMGTPAYMPPEQALGEIEQIDQRSDIYSLGAILYSLLTLQPPVEKGSPTDMLLRVVDGAVKSPEARAPERAIPPELSAIAMKALSKDRTDRYATVEALRRDVERFLEGRSVSAKRDSAWDSARKFVQRNKGLSAGLALALIVLLGSLIVVFSSWRETVAAYAKFEKEQMDKEQRTKQSVPAFLKAARLAVERKDFDDALAQATVASDYETSNAEAILLKGQLLASRKDFPAAAGELERYVKLRADDALAAKLAKLCASADADDPNVLEAIGAVLASQKQPNLAAGFFQSSAKQLAAYRQQLKDGGWLGKNAQVLEFDKDQRLTYSINAANDLDKYLDLAPFRGIPLSKMTLRSVRIQNLDPLRGMPLESLTLASLPLLRDLSGLRESPLTSLEISTCPLIDDLTPLKGLKLTKLDISLCPRVKDLTPLKGMPLDRFVLHGHTLTFLVEDLSPLRDLPLQHFVLDNTKVKNLEALRGMKLKSLAIRHQKSFTDLKPLKGMPLEELEIYVTSVADLSPLQGMSLKRLICSSTKVTDLRPLRGMPLTDFVFGGAGLKAIDLTPLEGMPLESITWPATIKDVKGLEVLRNMVSLRVINRLDAVEFWEKFDAGEFDK